MPEAGLRGLRSGCHTPSMAVPCKRGLLLSAICLAALPVRADEIQLKDGKTFYGVIVAFDQVP